MLAWARLLTIYGALRMDDLQLLHPKNVTMGEAGFSGWLTRTKCSGPGKKVRELFLFVLASLGVPDWLCKGHELWRISAPFPETTFLPRVSSDLSTFVPKLASTKVLVRDGIRSGLLSADFATGWTRSTVIRILAAVGCTEEDGAYLGRWASSSSEEYVRTYKAVVGSFVKEGTLEGAYEARLRRGARHEEMKVA